MKHICAHCGTLALPTDAKFCSTCGKELASPKVAKIDATMAPQSVFRREIGVWFAFGMVLFLYAVFFMLVLDGGRLGRQEIANGLFWPGVVGAYYWRKMQRSGWVGFGVGIVAGLIGLPTLVIIAGAFRHM